MGQSKPIKRRDRTPKAYMSAEDCAQKAADLFAAADAMEPGAARQGVLKDACDYRMLAEMKRMIAAPKGRSPSVRAIRTPEAS